MSWLDNYRQASFRGVKFFVESHDASFGRRQVTHEYPQRDQPYTEDLGRKAREFSLEAYVIGDDYDVQRDRLIVEIEKGGAGELVHPYLGNIDVVCTGLKVREAKSDLRVCQLQLTFVESGLAQYPSNRNDAASAVSSAGDKVASAASQSFVDTFAVDGFQSFVSDAAVARVQELSDLLQEFPTNSTADDQVVASFLNQVRSLGENAPSWLSDPAGLAAEYVDILSQIRAVFGDRSDSVLKSVRETYGASYTGSTATPSRAQEGENYNAFGSLARQVLIVQQAINAAVRAESSNGFDTRDEAIAVRDEVLDAIDVEMESSDTGIAEYQSLMALRTDVVNGVPSAELRLPRIVTVTPTATLPSLVVSYTIYGTAARADEIAGRNNAQHPGFLTGGQPLQVIANA